MIDLERRPSSWLEAALLVPSKMFSVLALVRGELYERGWFTSVDPGLPVISIGNLTTGGTGKTPITSFLTSKLAARGYDVSIISRGYGATETGPARVPADGSSEIATRFGDEPAWLASQHPMSPVVIGARRPEAVEFLRSIIEVKSAKQMVLADDAFQHRRLRRSLDIVIVDASAPRWHYRPLPLGRMREGFSALGRADFVFVSKTNLANAADGSWLLDHLSELSLKFGFKIVRFESTLLGVVPLQENGSQQNPERLTALVKVTGGHSKLRVGLMSGLARPETFERLFLGSENSQNVEVVSHFKFDDHAAFSSIDLERVESDAAQNNLDAIVVTEKDAVKLSTWRPKVPCFVTRLHSNPLDDLGDFYEAVDRLS